MTTTPTPCTCDLHDEICLGGAECGKKIPPGIVKMYSDDVNLPHDPLYAGSPGRPASCEEMGCKVHTICIDGTEWSVGDRVNVFGYIDKITRLTYESFIWVATLVDSLDHDVRLLRKLPSECGKKEEPTFTIDYHSKVYGLLPKAIEMLHECGVHELADKIDSAISETKLPSPTKEELTLPVAKEMIAEYRYEIKQLKAEIQTLKLALSADPRIEEDRIGQQKVWIKFIESWNPGETNSALGEVLQNKFMKDGWKDEYNKGYKEGWKDCNYINNPKNH